MQEELYIAKLENNPVILSDCTSVVRHSVTVHILVLHVSAELLLCIVLVFLSQSAVMAPPRNQFTCRFDL